MDFFSSVGEAFGLESAFSSLGLNSISNIASAVMEGDWETAFKEIGSLAVQYAVTAYTGNPQLGEMAANAFETTVNGGDFGEITQASIRAAVEQTVSDFAGDEAAQFATNAFDRGVIAARNGVDIGDAMRVSV